MHNSDPDDDTVLRRLQLTELEILKEAVRICETNRLRYFLIAGTLLGAVRHGGFIPWMMTWISLCLGGTMSSSCICAKSNLIQSTMCTVIAQTAAIGCRMPRSGNTIRCSMKPRLAISDVPKGIYVDVFPLDNANTQASLFQTARAGAVRIIGAVIFYRKGGCSSSRDIRRETTSVRTFLKALLKVLVVSVSHLLTMHALSKSQQGVMSWNRNDDAPCYVSLWSRYRWFRTTLSPRSRYCACCRDQIRGRESSVLHETGTYILTGESMATTWCYLQKRTGNAQAGKNQLRY